jgi:hypothetical protein
MNSVVYILCRRRTRKLTVDCARRTGNAPTKDLNPMNSTKRIILTGIKCSNIMRTRPKC